jgi:hypothetical protein
LLAFKDSGRAESAALAGPVRSNIGTKRRMREARFGGDGAESMVARPFNR